MEAQLSYTAVKAPFDGVITEKKVEAGELASPGQPLLKMEDPWRLRLETTVGEGDLKAVSRGEKIPVVIDALGGQALTGIVSQILPAGDPQTHTFVVKVDLPKTVGLKAGMFGRSLLAPIVLAVGLLSLLNALVVSVVERFRELGILRASGAADGDVLVRLAGALLVYGLLLVEDPGMLAVRVRLARALRRPRCQRRSQEQQPQREEAH